MLTMLIADDEPVIINGLKMLIDWSQLGIEICCTCENGSDALSEILARKPDLALLDISMPGMIGIEILKALYAVQSKTKVIFISGFQDFSYAHDALSYGAVEYLLKPVKKDELLRAVQKCLPVSVDYEEPDGPSTGNGLQEAFSRAAALSPSRYLLVAVQPLGLTGRNQMEMQLIKFSFFGQLDTLCQQEKRGFAFQKGQNYFLLLTDMTEQQADDWLHEVQKKLSQRSGCSVGFVYSPATTEMNLVPTYTRPCRDVCQRYFYFEGWLPDTVLAMDRSPFAERQATPAQLHALQEEIASTFMEQDRDACSAAVDRYLDAVACAADGRADTAMYHLLVCRRIIQDRLEKTGVRCAGGSNELMDAAREAPDYRAVTRLFRQALDELYEKMAGQVRKNEHKDIRRVMDYISEHYRENLTLDVLAKHIHMNSFYFSSYFKKQVGQNFKDYLNRVRMEHAMELLLSTDKRSYEIADEVGFRDYRYFNEVFSRYYGKTPAAYRKEFLAGKGEAHENE